MYGLERSEFRFFVKIIYGSDQSQTSEPLKWSKCQFSSFYNYWIWFHLISRKITVAETHYYYCGNFWILLPATVFSQKFRQINVLLKNSTINWFDGKKFEWPWISRFSTQWERRFDLHSAVLYIGSVKSFLLLFIQQFSTSKLFLGAFRTSPW